MYTIDETLSRCPWHKGNTLAIAYHDTEWGTPLHGEKKHFEFLVLDAFQAGLSWNTILNKRENFRKAFDEFNYEKIAKYNQDKINALLSDAGIIRNKLKIEATISNASAFIKIQEKFGSFDAYIWRFVDGSPIVGTYSNLKEIPPKTALSDKISKDLIQHGFRFVGSTIIYAYMQAAGLVNDHLVDCFRYEQLKNA
ncbi:MAG TPA: DNA-3-methyladenine glycosylase I [Bacteroidales bacterium]|nr:DNA-3-methyladenine glycosylase I [Bacteroidales bacterium]